MDSKTVSYHDCPECKEGKIKFESVLTDEGVETTISDCDKCGFRLDIDEMLKKYE